MENDIIIWTDENEARIMEAYYETLTFDDIPASYSYEIVGDDTDDWDRAFENWVEDLTIDDIPEDFIKDLMDRLVD